MQEENEKQNTKRVRILTKQKRILTLTITNQTSERIIGYDKFGVLTIIPFSDIHEMLPISERREEEFKE